MLTKMFMKRVIDTKFVDYVPMNPSSNVHLKSARRGRRYYLSFFQTY